MSIDPVHQQSYEEFAAFIEQDLLDSAIEWTTYEAEQHRRVEGMFGCGDVDITVEARVDFDGTIPFVAVRTPDTEAMLDVDGIDRLITALAWARQDLMRLAGDLT
ncbi:hypothetical protein [Rhodococcus sp. EPR-157]|uniref:hypothetical protein n=1 Tax=Rhodococcus sp. EPR-157 TaxID=1813677 RepID=UPI0012E8251A|nr:hypothetical protein [Rhodococcus sp. EPR-157]